MAQLANVHPGEVLKEEFLVPMGISQYRLAKEIGVTESRISAICQGKRAVGADTAAPVLPVSLVLQPPSGLACRVIMILRRWIKMTNSYS